MSRALRATVQVSHFCTHAPHRAYFYLLFHVPRFQFAAHLHGCCILLPRTLHTLPHAPAPPLHPTLHFAARFTAHRTCTTTTTHFLPHLPHLHLPPHLLFAPPQFHLLPTVLHYPVGSTTAVLVLQFFQFPHAQLDQFVRPCTFHFSRDTLARTFATRRAPRRCRRAHGLHLCTALPRLLFHVYTLHFYFTFVRCYFLPFTALFRRCTFTALLLLPHAPLHTALPATAHAHFSLFCATATPYFSTLPTPHRYFCVGSAACRCCAPFAAPRTTYATCSYTTPPHRTTPRSTPALPRLPSHLPHTTPPVPFVRSCTCRCLTTHPSSHLPLVVVHAHPTFTPHLYSPSLVAQVPLLLLFPFCLRPGRCPVPLLFVRMVVRRVRWCGWWCSSCCWL